MLSTTITVELDLLAELTDTRDRLIADLKETGDNGQFSSWQNQLAGQLNYLLGLYRKAQIAGVIDSQADASYKYGWGYIVHMKTSTPEANAWMADRYGSPYETIRTTQADKVRYVLRRTGFVERGTWLLNGLAPSNTGRGLLFQGNGYWLLVRFDKHGKVSGWSYTRDSGKGGGNGYADVERASAKNGWTGLTPIECIDLLGRTARDLAAREAA